MEYHNNTILNFGKHKGKKMLDVIESDINYVCWCIEKVEEFKLSEESKKSFIDNKDKIRASNNTLTYALMTDKDKFKREEMKNIFNQKIVNLLKLNDSK